MSNKTRKPKASFTPAQKLEYAKLMVEEGYTNQQVMQLSRAGAMLCPAGENNIKQSNEEKSLQAR